MCEPLSRPGLKAALGLRQIPQQMAPRVFRVSGSYLFAAVKYGAPFMTCKTTTLNILTPAPSSGKILNYVDEYIVFEAKFAGLLTSTW